MSDLTIDEKVQHYLEQLATEGYIKINAAIDTHVAESTLKKIKNLYVDFKKNDISHVPFLNQGHEMVYNLQNKDSLFLKIFLEHPIISQILLSCLNDQWYKQIPQNKPNYILRSLLARSSGAEPLPLHIDSFIPSSGRFTWAIQVAIVLEKQDLKNGCTMIVPGSHKFDRYANQQTDIGAAVPLTSEVGDVVIWDSRLWHGALGNETQQSRWSLIATFVRWWVKQNYDITGSLPQHIYDDFTPEQKAILGFCSIPPKNEFDRIDIKGGYELLNK